MFLRDLREGNIAIDQYQCTGDSTAWREFIAEKHRQSLDLEDAQTLLQKGSFESTSSLSEDNVKSIAEQLAWRQTPAGMAWRKKMTGQI